MNSAEVAGCGMSNLLSLSLSIYACMIFNICLALVAGNQYIVSPKRPIRPDSDYWKRPLRRMSTRVFLTQLIPVSVVPSV